MIKNLCGKGRKHCGKKRKCWLPGFSPFPTMLSKAFSPRVVKSRDCVVKIERVDGLTKSCIYLLHSTHLKSEGRGPGWLSGKVYDL